MKSEDVRPVLNTQGKTRLAELGHAVGEPNSVERQNDLVNLWDTNLPDLHLVVPRDETRKQEWFDIFLNLQEGQSYYLRVLSALPVDTHQESLFQTLQPAWTSDAPCQCR